MIALHRLVGNTPKRGFGAGLFSPGFPGGFNILANTDIRLPMTNVPGEKSALPGGGPVEAYRTFEVQPLRFGLVAPFQSVKINMEGSRPSSYTNTAIPSGDEVKENVTDGPGIAAILRFNGFISDDTFLNLSRNSLDVTEWTCMDEAVLERYQLPAAVTPEKHRALLSHYWRAATVQRFGPWDVRTGQCVYESHPLMWEYLPTRNTVVLCLGTDGSCDRIIDAARSFLWKYVLRMLPGAVSNIASMSAAVPARFVSSIYRDTALAIVYPEQSDNIKFDFRSGAVLEITPEEDAFMKMILSGKRPAYLDDMVQRYCAISGNPSESGISFLADYDIAWHLYRLENGDMPLREQLKSWFAVNRYLEDRHGLSGRQIHLLLAAVDGDILARLSGEVGEMKAALKQQEDERCNRVTDLLLTFLWSKALSADDAQFHHIAPLLTAYYTPEAEHFFGENLLAASINGEMEEARAASLTEDILKTNFMTAKPFGPRQISLMSSDKFTGMCAAHPNLQKVFCDFMEEETRKNPQNMLGMLPVTVQLLPRDSLMERLFVYLREEQLDQLPPLTASGGIRAGMAELDSASPARSAFSAYMTDCFVRHLHDFDQVCAFAVSAGTDLTDVLCSLLGRALEEKIVLKPEQAALLLGEDKRKNPYALCARKARAAEAFRAYLTGMTVESDEQTEDRSLWMLRLRNAGGACLMADGQNEAAVRDWIEDLFIRYVVKRGRENIAVPGDDIFKKLESIAIPKREPAFERLSGQVLDMYETILSNGASDQRRWAEKQVRSLLPAFTSTMGYPQIIQVELRCTCEKLINYWHSNTYWRGVSMLDGDLRRSQLDPRQLMTPEVQQAGITRLDADLAPLTSYPEFYAIYNTYKNRPENGFPPKSGELTFALLCFDRLRAHFVDRFDQQVSQCRDLSELQQLQEYSEKIMRTASKTDTVDGGRCIRAVRKVSGILNSLTDRDEKTVILEKVRQCAYTLLGEDLPRTECYHHTVGLLRSAFLENRREELNQRAFHIRLAVNLVCNIAPDTRTIRWRDVIAQLCPEYGKMMRSPFSASEFPLFQTINYMFSVLANQMGTDGTFSLQWAKSLANFLNNDSEFSGYSAKVRKEKKMLRQFIPYLLEPSNLSNESMAIKMWLNPEMKR